MKKFAKYLLIPVLAFLSLASVPAAFAINNNDGTTPNPADDTTSETTASGTTTSDPCNSIFGLVAWNCNVDLEAINSTDTLSTGVWTIVANVATDLTIIAAYAVLGYVIYGGYLYIFAAGDTGKVAAGKKTLSQAFIGLAIVMSANVILNTIRIALGANFAKNCAVFTGTPPEGCANVADTGVMVTSVVQWFIGVAGVVAVIFVVYGAISYITSAGDAGKVAKAKNLIVYSLIGLAIVAIAEIGTAFVSNLIRQATNPSFLLSNSSIQFTKPSSAQSQPFPQTSLIKSQLSNHERSYHV